MLMLEGPTLVLDAGLPCTLYSTHETSFCL